MSIETSSDTDRDGIVRYSNTNPPTSLNEAKERLDHVDVALTGIRNDLEIRTSDEFPTEAEFRHWEKCAICAEGHTMREKSFLISWINAEERRLRWERENKERQEERQGPIVRFGNTIDTFVASIPHHKTRYSEEHPPQTLRECTERREALLRIKHEAEAFLISIKGNRDMLLLTPHQVDIIKAPLIAALKTVDQEMAHLRRMLREFQVQGRSVLPFPTEVQTNHFNGQPLEMVTFLSETLETLRRGGAWTPSSDQLARHLEILLHVGQSAKASASAG